MLKTNSRKTPGPLSIVDDLSQRLLRRWVPKWYEVFRDPDSALFYERVGQRFDPILTGRRRLLTQFRQIALYGHARKQNECFIFQPDLKAHVDTFCDAYRGGQNGAWIFALDDDGQPIDRTLDLYGHAFVIFALAHYDGDKSAKIRALETLNFIDNHFRDGVDEGFVESLDADGKPKIDIRRHESHMHLLEACLFAYDVWNEHAFIAMASEIITLFFARFYNPETNILSEYFTADLTPCQDPNKGSIICESGHYFEWIWLLKKYAKISRNLALYDQECVHLLTWGNNVGWDKKYGGYFDEMAPDGSVITDTKRLWPFAEGLKANALLLDQVPDKDATKDRMADMVALFRDSYMQERGFWTEWLNRDLSPAVDYMPGTTPYHVYFGIMEARDILSARGSSKSWRAGPRRAGYALRRSFSMLLKRVKGRPV